MYSAQQSRDISGVHSSQASCPLRRSAFDLAGTSNVNWKIGCYSPGMEQRRENPADPTRSVRVLIVIPPLNALGPHILPISVDGGTLRWHTSGSTKNDREWLDAVWTPCD